MRAYSRRSNHTVYIAGVTPYIIVNVLDLIYFSIGGSRGACPVHAPPHGTQFFRFRIHFHRKVPTSEVHSPPMGAGPPYGKSWICHCLVCNLQDNCLSHSYCC